MALSEPWACCLILKRGCFCVQHAGGHLGQADLVQRIHRLELGRGQVRHVRVEDRHAQAEGPVLGRLPQKPHRALPREVGVGELRIEVVEPGRPRPDRPQPVHLLLVHPQVAGALAAARCGPPSGRWKSKFTNSSFCQQVILLDVAQVVSGLLERLEEVDFILLQNECGLEPLGWQWP